RQHRAVAAARQPDADAAGDADLPALHPAADRARRSGHPGLSRQPLEPDAAPLHRGHHEDARALAELSDRLARDPRDRDAASGLPAALADLQAAGLAGFFGDPEGAGVVARMER